MYVESRPAGPLVLVTPDMPEQEKHKYFSAAFGENPIGLGLVRALNSFDVPTSIVDITRRAEELGIDVDQWAKRFGAEDPEPAPSPLTVEQVTGAVEYLSLGLGLVEVQEGNMVQLTTEGRVYVDRQLTLIDEATQDLK